MGEREALVTINETSRLLGEFTIQLVICHPNNYTSNLKNKSSLGVWFICYVFIFCDRGLNR